MYGTIPLESAEDGWNQELPIMVVPLSFTQFMECFWSDAAPYYIPAFLSKEKDQIVNYSNWSDPTDFDKHVFGDNVI